MEDKGQILLYQTPDGVTKIEVKLQNETVWLSLDQMAELFQRNKSTISRHIKNVFEEGELNRELVVAKNATTTQHGAIDGKTQTHNVEYYNLDMIISVGYRVHSYRGVQFRQWATSVLIEYIKKGFVLNDELLKNAGRGNYFDELLARIRDIRSSEKIFYRKVLEIYALSIDYDPRVEITKQFFATVQNKMHFAAHGHTAAEIIYDRANAAKDFMGLTTWTGMMPKRTDAEFAKNYHNEEEIDTLNSIVKDGKADLLSKLKKAAEIEEKLERIRTEKETDTDRTEIPSYAEPMSDVAAPEVPAAAEYAAKDDGDIPVIEVEEPEKEDESMPDCPLSSAINDLFEKMPPVDKMVDKVNSSLDELNDNLRKFSGEFDKQLSDFADQMMGKDPDQKN